MKSIYPTCHLGKLVTVEGGKRLPQGEKYAQQITKHPYLRVCNFVRGSIDETDLRYLTEETHSKISQYTISSEDIYISIAGTIGIVGTVPKHLSNANLTENAAKLVIQNINKLDQSYLVHYLTTLGQHQIKKQVNVTSQSKLALFRIQKIKIPLPPLEKQRQIAAILDKADSICQKREQAIKLTEELLRSKFLEMFGNPVSNPYGWKLERIGDLGKIITGNTPPRSNPENYGEYIEWIKSDNINTPYHFLTTAAEKLSYQGKQIARTVPAESILVTCIAGSPNSIGRAALTDREVSFNQQINAIIPKKNVNPYFLYSQFFVAQQLVQAQSSNSIKGLVNKSRFSNIVLMNPPLEKQEVFGNWFLKFHKWLEKLYQDKQLTEQLFNSFIWRLNPLTHQYSISAICSKSRERSKPAPNSSSASISSNAP
ncbi:MAG: restriction endonuclease subunit S, partial [Cyanobacteriota bacterium]|nr:restriction endonuclease subunit S [Cyanobacteriota bacterium]